MGAAVLIEPMGEKIWFAGEDLAASLLQAAAGAGLSVGPVAGKVALWFAHQNDPA